jgi:glycerol-3-phosphate dehydrogenase
VTPTDVVWTFSGVRPLYDDGASDAKAATREYVFELDRPNDGAPLLSIFGGKITTYRRLAEEALEKLAPHLRGTAAREGWTASALLPGGNFDVLGLDAQIDALRRDYPFLEPAHARRLVGAYGTNARKLLRDARAMADLGRSFGATLTERELRYLMEHEWATTAEDVVWRRSKLGLRLSPTEIAAIETWMVAQRNGAATPRKAGGAA